MAWRLLKKQPSNLCKKHPLCLKNYRWLPFLCCEMPEEECAGDARRRFGKCLWTCYRDKQSEQSTSVTICCTIWSDVAKNFVFVPGQIVLIKGDKLVVWTSKSNLLTKSSKLYIDPQTKLAKQLKQVCQNCLMLVLTNLFKLFGEFCLWISV